MPPFPGRSTPGPALAEPAAKEPQTKTGRQRGSPSAARSAHRHAFAAHRRKKAQKSGRMASKPLPQADRRNTGHGSPHSGISLAKRSAGFVAHPSTSFLTKFPPRGGAAGCSSQVHHTMPGRHLQAFAPCRGTFLGPALISGCRRRGKPGPRSRPAPGKCWRRDRRRWAAACRRPVCRPHPGCSRRR